MLWRWGFLFLILANAVVLFWFSTYVDRSHGEVGTVNLKTIHLISEIEDKQALSSLSQQSEQYKPLCFDLNGFKTKSEAEYMAAELLREGLIANVETLFTPEQYYVTKVDVTSDREQTAVLLSFLQQIVGMEIKEQDLEVGGSYVLGSFTDRIRAELALQSYVVAGITAYLVLEEKQQELFTITVIDETGRKLSSEIKELVKKQKQKIKIEKKVCEGVARSETTE